MYVQQSRLLLSFPFPQTRAYSVYQVSWSVQRMRTSSTFLPAQWIEPNSDFNVSFPFPVFLQPEFMGKGFSTIDVFSNACTTKDSDAHLASGFHSCQLTDEKCHHADTVNSDPDSIGECFCDCICFSQLHQCSCDPSAVTHLLPHPSCYLLHRLLACPCHPTAAHLMFWNPTERA